MQQNDGASGSTTLPIEVTRIFGNFQCAISYKNRFWKCFHSRDSLEINLYRLSLKLLKTAVHVQLKNNWLSSRSRSEICWHALFISYIFRSWWPFPSVFLGYVMKIIDENIQRFQVFLYNIYLTRNIFYIERTHKKLNRMYTTYISSWQRVIGICISFFPYSPVGLVTF